MRYDIQEYILVLMDHAMHRSSTRRPRMMNTYSTKPNSRHDSNCLLIQAQNGDPEMMLLASQMLFSGYGCEPDAKKAEALKTKALQRLSSGQEAAKTSS
jgi:hypothetical protein